MNYPDIQKIFDEQNLLCFGGPSSECSGCKFGNCYGCSDLRLLEAYEAAIKLEIEADKIEIRNKIEVLESHLESKKKQINFILRCKDKIEIDRDRQKLDNVELAQCNVELSKDNERLRKALKPFEWFGVEDRLPDLAPTHNPIQVIVCYGISRYTCSAVFNDGTFYFCESVEDGDHWTDNPISCVTHWMPIPEFKAAETLEGKQV